MFVRRAAGSLGLRNASSAFASSATSTIATTTAPHLRALSSSARASESLAEDALNHFVAPHDKHRDACSAELGASLASHGLELVSPELLNSTGKINPVIHLRKQGEGVTIDVFLDAREYSPAEFDDDEVDEPSEIDDADVSSDDPEFSKLVDDENKLKDDDDDDDESYFEEEAYVPVQIEFSSPTASSRLVVKAFVGRNEDEDDQVPDEIYLRSLPQYQSAINNLDRVFALEGICVVDAAAPACRDLTGGEFAQFRNVETGIDDYTHLTPNPNGQDFDGVYDSLCTYFVTRGVTAEMLGAVLFQAQHTHDSIQAEFGRNLSDFLNETK